MKKYSCYLLVLFILWVPEVVGQQDHFHVHTEEEEHELHKNCSVDQRLVDCFENSLQEVLVYSEYNNWEDIFFNRYGIYFDEFSELNKMHIDALKSVVLGEICSGDLEMSSLFTFVFDFIDSRISDLLFERPEGALPGESILGKYYILPENMWYNQNKSQRGWGEPCNNPGFETGDYTGWETYCGRVNNNPYEIENETLYDPFTSTCGSAQSPHLIVSGGNDPVTGIPMLNPNGGGNYSVRIGDGPNLAFGSAMLRQTFLVDANNAMFSYSYAAIFTINSSHTPANQPFLSIRVYDENDNEVVCGRYQAYAGDGQSGWTTVPGSNISYLDWRTVFIPLDLYIGQNITIEIITGDCNDTGHYGYAYFDASCEPLEITASNDGVICDGEEITLFAPGGGSSYLWSPGGETTSSIQVDASGLYSVTISPVSGAGTCDDVQLSYNVTEAPYPVADFTMAPSTVCENDDISFTDNSAVSSGNIEFWQWDFGDGVVTQSANGPITNETDTEGTYEDPVHTYGASGNLNVTLTVTSDAGCSATATHPVTVSPAPLISAGPDQNLCPGDPFTPQGQGGVSYTWDQGLTDGVEIAVGTTTITYAVTGVDAIGCFATDSVTIFIDQVEVPDAGSDQVVCDGESVILSASTDPGYAWDNGVQDGVAFVPSQTTVYTITYTSPNGCQASDDVLVTVNSNPAVWAGNDISVCEGETVVLTGSGAVSYEWDNGVIDGQSFVPDRSGTYTVIGTDQNGCQNTDDVYLNWVATPQVDFIADTLDGCIPIHVTYTANTTGAIASCLWNFGDGSTSTQCGDISHTYSAQGCYTVSYSVATAEGCANEITKNDYICSYPNPTADFTPTPNILTTLDWESEMINESSGAVSYLWDFGDESPTSTEVSPTHEFPTNYGGDYLVTLIAYSEDGCADTISQLVVVNEVILYYVPNAFTPDNDDFNEVFKPVFSQGYDPYNYNMLIFNRWGEVLFESNDAEFGWDGTYGGKIVEDGTYVWKITYKVKDIDKRHIISGHVTLIR